MRQHTNYLAVVFLLVSLTALGSDQKHEDNEAESKPSCVTHTVVNETTNVTHTVTRCSGEAIGDLPHKQPEPKNIDQNSKKNPNPHWELINNFDDLAAQNSMAKSTEKIRDFTFWIFWVALGSLLASIAGICLVAYTINQNRKTFKHITTSSSLELQPYLQFSSPLDKPPPSIYISNAGKDGWIRFGVQFRIRNTGKTPARNIRNFVISSSSEIVLPEELSYHSVWASLDPKKDFYVEVLFPNEECHVAVYLNCNYTGTKLTGVSKIDELGGLAFNFKGSIYFDGSCLSSGGVTTRRAAFAIDHNMIGGETTFGAGHGLNMRITGDDQI